MLAGGLDKAQFWQRWAGTPMNERQTLVLNRVLDGMNGRLTNARWAALAHCSPDTALRDINGLPALGVLGKLEGGGHNASPVTVMLPGCSPRLSDSARSPAARAPTGHRKTCNMPSG